ncbi:MAG TPA: hypothetical protein GXX23_04445 [Firmicutes bacterium]|nr:hypothetical protein [Candidatus Fermentithermobacillaceae bacterium]
MRKATILCILAGLFVLGLSTQASAASYPSYWYNPYSYYGSFYNYYYSYYYRQPAPAPAPAPTPNPAPSTPSASGLTADEQAMINLVNQERAKAGLKPLAVDMRLVTLARQKSQDMITNNYFSHQSPTYGSPFDMMRKAGITYRTAGENLAGASTVQQAHSGLMNSSGHRANILNPNYTHIGVGVVRGGRYGAMWTQMFIGK